MSRVDCNFSSAVVFLCYVHRMTFNNKEYSVKGVVRALLVRGNRPYRLSKHHSVFNARERNRIIENGTLFCWMSLTLFFKKFGVTFAIFIKSFHGTS